VGCRYSDREPTGPPSAASWRYGHHGEGDDTDNLNAEQKQLLRDPAALATTMWYPKSLRFF